MFSYNKLYFTLVLVLMAVLSANSNGKHNGHSNDGWHKGNGKRGGYKAGGYKDGGYKAGGYKAGGYKAGGYNAGGYNAGGHNHNCDHNKGDSDNQAVDCSVQRKCVNTLDSNTLVWAVDYDARTCSVFRNGCQFINNNCNRQSLSLKNLRKVRKGKCQKFCNTICSPVAQTVCAEYNDELRNFYNQCELDKHICTTGETFQFYRDSACPILPTTESTNASTVAPNTTGLPNSNTDGGTA